MFADDLENALSEAKMKFKKGDIVRRTKKAMQSMGMVSGAINGKVSGYDGRFVMIVWSDDPTNEPRGAAEIGIELDKRAMAKAKRSGMREGLAEMDLGTEHPIGMPSAGGYTKPGGSGDARSGYGSVPDPQGQENSHSGHQSAAVAQAAAVFRGLYRMGPGDKVMVKGETYVAQSSVQMGPQKSWLTVRGPSGDQFMLMVPAVAATRSKAAEWMTIMQTGRASTAPVDIKTVSIYAENLDQGWLNPIEEGDADDTDVDGLSEGNLPKDTLKWMEKEHGVKDLRFQGGEYAPSKGVMGQRETHRQKEEIDKLGHSLFDRQYASEWEGRKGVWVTYRGTPPGPGRGEQGWYDKMMELVQGAARLGYKAKYKAGNLSSDFYILFDQKKVKAAEGVHNEYLQWMAGRGSSGARKRLGGSYVEGAVRDGDELNVVDDNLVEGWKALDESGFGSSQKAAAIAMRIEKMTDRNDHTGSVLALANAMGNKPMVKAIQAIVTIQDFYGHMPDGLSKVRDDMRNQLLRYAKQSWSKENYDRLRMAF